MMRWLIGFGVVMVVVGVWMVMDGTWAMSEDEYQQRIAARKKARAAKAAESSRAKR